MRHEEWHVTVKDPDLRSVTNWQMYCLNIGIKPLWIQLNDFSTQLMYAAKHQVFVDKLGWNVVRIKREVSDLLPGETAIYWECHVKLDGVFRPEFPMASRDLYRSNNDRSRWYRTHRQVEPFNPRSFVDRVNDECRDSVIAGWEYEACLLDTNPGLDAEWVGKAEAMHMSRMTGDC